MSLICDNILRSLKGVVLSYEDSCAIIEEVIHRTRLDGLEEFVMGRDSNYITDFVLPIFCGRRDWRIVREDETYYILTNNIRTTRLNVEIDNKVITKAWWG